MEINGNIGLRFCIMVNWLLENVLGRKKLDKLGTVGGRFEGNKDE
jgi:hypothetical protein